MMWWRRTRGRQPPPFPTLTFFLLVSNFLPVVGAGESFVFTVVFFVKDCGTDKAKDWSRDASRPKTREGDRFPSSGLTDCRLWFPRLESWRACTDDQPRSRRDSDRFSRAIRNARQDSFCHYQDRLPLTHAATQRAKRHENVNPGGDHLLRGLCKNQADGVTLKDPSEHLE